MLFLANYPTVENIHEGMSQRVVAIDRQFEKAERVYLFVSYRLFWKKEAVVVGNGIIQYRCNLLAHFFFIRRLMRSANALYFHSVINVLPLLPFLRFIRKQSVVILDAHGVVPEELHYQGISRKSRLYQFAEQRIFRRVNHVITVSNTMTNHFRNKYPEWTGNVIHYPILPAHIVNGAVPTVSVCQNHMVSVIYSGNLQSWQNIDLMISLIKDNLSDRISYTLLTGQPDEMRKRLVDAGIVLNAQIEVLTVSPEELQAYYQSAHYGFILRDDMLINRVACPTKMVEYLHYGITPIVKSSHIGDFEDLDYEYIRYEDFSTTLPVMKSMRNQKLMQQYVARLHRVDFEQLITCER